MNAFECFLVAAVFDVAEQVSQLRRGEDAEWYESTRATYGVVVLGFFGAGIAKTLGWLS